MQNLKKTASTSRPYNVTVPCPTDSTCILSSSHILCSQWLTISLCVCVLSCTADTGRGVDTPGSPCMLSSSDTILIFTGCILATHICKIHPSKHLNLTCYPLFWAWILDFLKKAATDFWEADTPGSLFFLLFLFFFMPPSPVVDPSPTLFRRVAGSDLL